MTEWSCEMPFWIDTEAYSDRDRMMFVCGVEFEMIRNRIRNEERGVTIPIHRENESRIRMMCARLGVPCEISQHDVYEGCETWSDLSLWPGGE